MSAISVEIERLRSINAELLAQLKLARSLVVTQATMLVLLGKVDESPLIEEMDAAIARAEDSHV